MGAVSIERNVPYGSGGPRRRLDIYRPPGTAATALPAVLFVTGYPDAGAEKVFGCRLMDMAAYVCWARLIACLGLVGVLYENEEAAADARAVLDDVRTNAESLGVDAKRLGLWSCSGNVPNALGLIADNPDLACAALVYGYTTDFDGHRDVARPTRSSGSRVPRASSWRRCAGRRCCSCARDETRRLGSTRRSIASCRARSKRTCR